VKWYFKACKVALVRISSSYLLHCKHGNKD
jgi:hypothetical protein